jgi:hypothetical protein
VRTALTLMLGTTLASGAAPASAVFFGADLRRPANATFDCQVVPSVTFPLASGATTCTWFGTGSATSSRESFNVPAGRGRVVRVAVRVGAATGPMRVIVMRSVRAEGSAVSSCCRERLRSRIFTPRTNAVTRVRVNFAVRNDRVPNPESNAYSFDTLALSVLRPGVPIPAHDTGITDPLAAPLAATFFPALAPRQLRADAAGTAGYQVLLRGEWLPSRR